MLPSPTILDDYLVMGVEVISAVDCRKGGLITQNHNEVKDALSDLAALSYWEGCS